ncbi:MULTISPECIES: hypothetical protein [Cupriavidus]|uniref:Uncharacterized protein n=1 Tax=Cupriavidus oxalaticus TaxID=96344 RepID=A0A4P7L3L6_9BURK|nr:MULTISPECIES: hypothetical protein [Cupriavidus]MBF6987949.1 hypothetical protein [Cupriavidus sp. IK-TO18]QBY50048.1 hypothetical protein E0W60_02170 [Cupriavidus oxalaticus]TDF65472.1 hypothetical protein E1J61_12955 [Cupriavidus sp. L7L]
MKRLPRLSNSLLLSLALLAPVSGALAAVTTVCSAVQAAGLSLPERHAAAKMEAEAALGGGSEGSCRGAAVQVMVEPGGQGVPLQLQDGSPQPSDDDTATLPGQPAAAAGELPELPPEVMAHWAHAAPMATPAVFNDLLPDLLPFASRC